MARPSSQSMKDAFVAEWQANGGNASAAGIAVGVNDSTGRKWARQSH